MYQLKFLAGFEPPLRAYVGNLLEQATTGQLHEAHLRRGGTERSGLLDVESLAAAIHEHAYIECRHLEIGEHGRMHSRLDSSQALAALFQVDFVVRESIGLGLACDDIVTRLLNAQEFARLPGTSAYEGTPLLRAMPEEDLQTLLRRFSNRNAWVWYYRGLLQLRFEAADAFDSALTDRLTKDLSVTIMSKDPSVRSRTASRLSAMQRKHTRALNATYLRVANRDGVSVIATQIDALSSTASASIPEVDVIYQADLITQALNGDRASLPDLVEETDSGTESVAELFTAD